MNLINQSSSLILMGLIWTIQIVHYPLMAKVGEENFLDYHSSHSSLIGIIVIPMMFSELGSSIYLVSENFNKQNLIGLILVVLVWASTFLIQVPIHNELSKGYSLDLIQKLVYTNWIRTILWTAKAMMIFFSPFSRGM